MTLLDAIENDGSYSPSNITDTEVVMTSDKLENLINSILSDESISIPKDEISSAIMEKFNSHKEEIKDSIKSITQKYISDLEMSINTVSESTELTQAYIDSIKSVISEGLKDSMPDRDSLVSMITESTESLIDYEITKSVEIDDYSTSMIEQTSSGSNTESKSKVEITARNAADRIEKQLDSEELGSIANTWEGVKDQFETNYSGENIANELSKPFIDFATSFVLDIIEEPTKVITGSDAFNDIVNPFSSISGMVSEITNGVLTSFKNAYHDTLRTITDSVDDVNDAAKEWLKDKINTPFEAITGFVNNQAGKARSSILKLRDTTLKALNQNVMQLDNRERFRGVFSPTIIPVSEVLGVPSSKKDVSSPKSFGKLSDTSAGIFPKTNKSLDSYAVRRSDFVINRDDLFMSNDAYWDIKIIPHKHDDYSPPDINDIFGCSSSKRLPIISYTFDAGGLSNSQFEIYPGVQFSIPTSYSRPSTLSFSILNLVKTGQNQVSCFDMFRDSYIGWVLGDSRIERHLDTLPACLDYHYCAYEITIVKYSTQWFPLRKWNLLGIPQITIYEQGGSSSAQEIQSLNFSIIGSWNELHINADIVSSPNSEIPYSASPYYTY